MAEEAMQAAATAIVVVTLAVMATLMGEVQGSCSFQRYLTRYRVVSRYIVSGGSVKPVGPPVGVSAKQWPN